MREGYHVQAKHKVGNFIIINDAAGGGGTVPTIETFAGKAGQEKLVPWTIPAEHVLWTPKHLPAFAGEVAIDYYGVLALYFRVNGANSLYQRALHEVFNRKMPTNDTTLSKVTAFMDRHLRMAQEVDALQFPTDNALSVKDVASGGPTHYAQDTNTVRVSTEYVPLQRTPLEVLRASGVTDTYELEEFETPTEEAMGLIAFNIRERLTDEQLVRMFVTEEQEEHGEEEDDDNNVDGDAPVYRVEHFYPVRMESAAQCRLHSWYLACLVMINSAFREIRAVEDTHTRPMIAKHELHVTYAFHRIMVSYVQLMLHALTPIIHHQAKGEEQNPPPPPPPPRYRISDDDWRPQPDGFPSLLDRFFPQDTFAFHAGDLPALESVLSQVGWCGLQVVKDKIPLVKIFMKSLPVCCQCRDLVSALLTECRAGPKAEGFWRVVRAMFWCSFAGLYPHSRERPDFPSLMFIYDLLFNRKERFLAALEYEMLQYKQQEKRRKASGGGAKKKKIKVAEDENNRTSRLVFTVFREFFVHSMRNDKDWLARIQQRIDWQEFVVVTLNTSDKMRKYGMWGQAPAGNELLFAINAVWRETDGSSKLVYRYRKQTYEQLVQQSVNATQDRLNVKKLQVEADIAMATYILERLQHSGALDKSDIFSIYGHKELMREFGAEVDPTALYENDPQRFTQVMSGILGELQDKHTNHLAYALDPQIKSNIKTFLTQLKQQPNAEEERFRFDVLMNPELGGIDPESVRALYKTREIYATRSSPKSITNSIEQMPVHDIRVIAWYFNVLNRVGDISLFPLDLRTVNQQVHAMRTNRFRLMDDEPLPEHAWNVYVTICCGRITTFADQSTLGNLRLAYNITTGEYVCNKKMGRTMKAKAAAAAAAASASSSTSSSTKTQEDNEDENDDEEEKERGKQQQQKKRKPRQASATNTNKRAQTDRKNDGFLSCDNQPVMCFNIFGHALVFGGEKYMFCPQCAQFHTYSPLGWSKGYACGACRAKEVDRSKLKQCAFCTRQDRVEFGDPVDLIVLEHDPSNPGFQPLSDPMRCFQCLHMCKQDMHSIGVFERVPVNRLYMFTPKDDLWNIIQPANTERMIKNVKKYGR